MTALENAKQLLPLSALLAQLGLDDCVKKSAKCPLHDDTKNSFSVYETSDGKSAWKCFAGCGGGDEVDLIARLENLDNSAACKRYIELAGGKATQSFSTRQKADTPARRREKPAPLAGMPSEISNAWREGVEYAQDHPLIAKRLGEWRGWPQPFADYVIGCCTISMPLHDGERGTAFQVVAPIGERGSMTTLPIGYHVRLKTKQSGEKAEWRYMPNEQSHKQRTPSLPFILGEFESAKVLLVTEGQWDLLTFALAAGWLGDGCEWPSGVGMVGIRGASGTNTFLKYYRGYWPKNVNCLVLADTDEAGRSWTVGERCFASELTELCAKVVVVNCVPHKDFNALYRTEKVGPNEIRDFLKSHNISIEHEVTA